MELGGDFKQWNPMEDDFRNRRVNAYREGVGQDLQNRDISDVGRISESGHKPVVLYVTNIPLDMDEIALQNIFETEGRVIKVHIPVPSPEKVAQFNSKMGFVTMDNARGAQAAIEKLNGFPIKDKHLVVKVKLSREEIQRKKDHRERVEDFLKSMKAPEDQVAADPSSGMANSKGGSGAADPQGVPKSSGPYGSVASGAGDLSVTVHNGGRKVQDFRTKAGLLPSPDALGGAASAGLKAAAGVHPQPAVVSPGRQVRAPSSVGSDVGCDLCACCKKQASMRCKACRKVYYCNANCQREHWPMHRKVCTYDSKPAAVKAVAAREPDFENMEVDISESFISENREYLKEWLREAAVKSDSSSSSGDRQMKNKPKFFGGKKGQSHQSKPGQAMEGKSEGQPPRSENQGPYQKKEGQRLSQNQQRGKGAFGAGQNQGRQDGPGTQEQGTLPAFQQQRERQGPHGDGPRPRGDGPRPHGDGPGPRGDGPGPRGDGPKHPSYGPGPRSDGYIQRDRSDQPRRDGPGFQQGRKGPNQTEQGERPSQLQQQYGPQGPKNNQFQSKSGPQQGERPNQFQPRNGSRQGEMANQFQPQSGPRQAERANQFKPQSGPQQEKRANQFQPRNDPQQGRGGPYGPGDRGDHSHRQHRDGFGPKQRREGSQQDLSDPESRKSGYARSPQNNQSRPDQHPPWRDGDRKGGLNNRGPRNQRQERGNNNNNNNNREKRQGRPAGPHPSARSPVDDTDSWEEKTPKSPLPKPTPSAAHASPVAVQSETATSAATALKSERSAECQSLVPAGSEAQAAVLELNKPITVIVSHMENPQCFWVQTIEQLTASAPVLHEVVSTCPRTPATAAKVGQLFLCEYMGELARARIVSMTGNKVRIFYIDFGNSEDTEVSQLLPVPAEIASLPALGIPCTLRIFPSGGREWPAEVITLMKCLFIETEPCTLTVLVKKPSIYEVKLVRISDNLDAAEFLQKKGFGVDTAPVVADPPVASPPVTSPPVASPPVTSSPVASPPVTSSPVAALSEAAPARIMVTDMAKVTDAFSVGDIMDVLFLESLDPLKLFVRRLQSEKDFTDFSLRMRADYDDNPPAPYKPVVGEMVVGRFSQDNSWYRAEVLKVLPDSWEACLFYVDFGNKEQLPFEELRALKPAYAAKPIQGFCCTVGGIKVPADGEWQQEQLAAYVSCLGKFLKSVEDVPLCTIIVEDLKDSIVWVDVVHEKYQQSLAEELVEQMEGVLLPQPIQPQVVSSSKSSAAQASEVPPAVTVPDLEKPALNQPAIAASSQPAGLRKLTLSVGEQLTVGIQEIQSCHRFYVTNRAAEEDMNMLAERLNRFCLESGQEQLQACESVSAGDVVLVQFSVDNMWYRGLVENISDDGATCMIFFVDFGNREKKQLSSLRVIPAEFLALPAQAITCRLEGVPQSVSQELETVFQGAFLQVEVVIKVVSVTEDCYSVEIFTEEGKSALSLLGLLAHETSTPLSSPSPDLDPRLLKTPTSPCPPLEDVFSASPQMGASALPPSSPAMQQGTSAIPSPSPAIQQGCGDDVLPPLTRASLRFGLTETDRMENMMVTHVNSPSCLYAVSGMFTLAQHEEGGLVPQLRDLNSTAPPLDHLPSVGQLLSGHFEGEWFRCEVIEIVSSQVHVNFFDYGNEALLDLSELRPLPKELCDSYPLATIKCCIHGIRPASGETWDEETCVLTKQELENQWVSLQCVSVRDGMYHVQMTRDSGKEDVGQMLVDRGKAVSVTEAQNPSTKADSEREVLERQMRELQAKLAAMNSQQ